MSVEYTRTLKTGMSGTDVRYMKDCLFFLKQYKSSIKKISNSTFGSDTITAVKKYQKSHKDVNGKQLKADGIIGKLTWYAIERDYIAGGGRKSEPKPIVYLSKKDYPNLSDKTISVLNAAWQGVSATRIKFMQLALKQAYDVVNGTYKQGDAPTCLYIIGADLYTTSKVLFHPTKAYIEKRAKERPTYFSGGRKEWMLEQLSKNPNLCATDCSGQEVGIMRFLGLVKPTFDATANGLCSDDYSSAVTKSTLKPGDWVGKSGHIGLYLGADIVCEAAGGAYGVQLTNLNKRVYRNLMNGNLASMSEWTKFRKPKSY